MLTLQTAAERVFRDVDFATGRPVLVALSGGGDSLALLLLARARLSSVPAPLLAVTVDHALRDGSDEEARAVGRLCAGLGIAHSILRRRGERPHAGVMAAAREARHGLLLEAARRTGAGMILAGHTLDDQAETIWMRRARGGGRGLAGIAPATLLDGDLWLVRPLLGERRAALRDLLSQAGTDWFDDPSNDNSDYERVRARAALAGDDAMVARLAAEADAAARRREAFGRRAAALITAHAHSVSPGLVLVDAAAPDPADETWVHAIAILLAASGGREHLPEPRRVATLLGALRDGRRRATLAGVVVDVRRSGIFLRRELRGGWTGEAPADAGMLWDGRYRLGRDLPDGWRVAALGRVAASATVAGCAATPAMVRAALAAEPALRRAADPGAGMRPAAISRALTRAPAPWARYLPSFDLAPARAVASLLGCPPVPSPPLKGHNAA